MASEKKPRRDLRWQDAVRATALYAAGTHWTEILRVTGVTESQLRRIRQLYNTTQRER